MSEKSVKVASADTGTPVATREMALPGDVGEIRHAQIMDITSAPISCEFTSPYAVYDDESASAGSSSSSSSSSSSGSSTPTGIVFNNKHDKILNDLRWEGLNDGWVPPPDWFITPPTEYTVEEFVLAHPGLLLESAGYTGLLVWVEVYAFHEIPGVTSQEAVDAIVAQNISGVDISAHGVGDGRAGHIRGNQLPPIFGDAVNYSLEEGTESNQRKVAATHTILANKPAIFDLSTLQESFITFFDVSLALRRYLSRPILIPTCGCKFMVVNPRFQGGGNGSYTNAGGNIIAMHTRFPGVRLYVEKVTGPMDFAQPLGEGISQIPLIVSSYVSL